MDGRGVSGWGAVSTVAPAAARSAIAGPGPAWERWGWVAVRAVAGWTWLDQGSHALASAPDGWALALATGQVLAGIAVMLGFLTGAAAALLVISEPIIRVLYERGAFAASNSTPTVSAILAIFGLGLPAFVLIKAFTPGYFAREDTRTPMVFAAVSVAVNISLALALFPSMGAPGIATASAVAGWVNAAMLLYVLIRRGHWGTDIPLLTRIPRLVLAAAVMAGALHVAAGRLEPYLASSAPLHTQALTLAVLVSAGSVIYFGVAFGIGGADLGMVRRNIRRGAASSQAVE